MGDKSDDIARTVVCILQICRGHRYTKEYRTHSFLCDEQAAKVAQAIRMAVEEEREQCEKIAAQKILQMQNFANDATSRDYRTIAAGYELAASSCGDIHHAIRSRSQS